MIRWELRASPSRQPPRRCLFTLLTTLASHFMRLWWCWTFECESRLDGWHVNLLWLSERFDVLSGRENETFCGQLSVFWRILGMRSLTVHLGLNLESKIHFFAQNLELFLHFPAGLQSQYFFHPSQSLFLLNWLFIRHIEPTFNSTRHAEGDKNAK